MRACVKTWIYRKNEIFEELQVWNGSKLEYLQEASKESRGDCHVYVWGNEKIVLFLKKCHIGYIVN